MRRSDPVGFVSALSIGSGAVGGDRRGASRLRWDPGLIDTQLMQNSDVQSGLQIALPHITLRLILSLEIRISLENFGK